MPPFRDYRSRSVRTTQYKRRALSCAEKLINRPSEEASSSALESYLRGEVSLAVLGLRLVLFAKLLSNILLCLVLF